MGGIELAKIENNLRKLGWPSHWSIAVADSVSKRVELGYSGTIDDYTNDLAVREWLSHAEALMGDDSLLSLQISVEPIDKRFMASTRGVIDSLTAGDDEWWYRRLPKVLIGELRKDAERLGLES